jgi:hypothetical protein
MPVAVAAASSAGAVVRVWNFLLPDTGEHELRLELVGASTRVILDGVELQAPEGTTSFTGPGASLLELTKVHGCWQLQVNGYMVEDYTAAKRPSYDDSLHDLRGRPDGSYTIATKISAAGMALNIVRRFRFSARGVQHEVEIAHRDWVWQVIHDGVILERLTHRVKDDRRDMTFTVDVGEGTKLDAEVSMEWQPDKKVWRYALAVNHIGVPILWTKTGGWCSKTIPEVVGVDPSHATMSVLEQQAAEDAAREALAVDILPQGVSYDAESGAYQANINLNGRFMFLGEFFTPEEAYQRYLEEMEKHGKSVAP